MSTFQLLALWGWLQLPMFLLSSLSWPSEDVFKALCARQVVMNLAIVFLSVLLESGRWLLVNWETLA